MSESAIFEDVKKPRKDAKLPRKGKLVCGKSLTLSGFGTIRHSPTLTSHMFSATPSLAKAAFQQRRKPTRSSSQSGAVVTGFMYL